MLSEKEKYHQTIALEIKAKVDRLGYFLSFENGTLYQKFRLGVEEGLPIDDLKNIFKDLSYSQLFNNIFASLKSFFSVLPDKNFMKKSS